MRRFASLLLATTIASASLALTSSDAHACGGVFCDVPPPNQPPMPVDQSGENVLFVVANGQVEAHVQIQYTGNPERFAWVVPMPKKPKITAGSQKLFSNLLRDTVPTFQTQNTVVQGCSNGFFSGETVGCGAGDSAQASLESSDFASGSAGSGSGSLGKPSGPQVLDRASVGSYTTVTLGGGSAEELTSWLHNNNYLVPDKTTSLLSDYLEQGYVFVAVRLNAGAGLSEIHPLVFTYEGDQPCVPLKLTAVAAVENMGVRTFFLGKERFAPKNYKHVVVNDLLFDWSTTYASGGFDPMTGQQIPSDRQINYNEIITKAVDSPLANGRAFVTEYAGTSGVVDPSGIYNGQWKSDPYRTASPEKVINLLTTQGLLNCPSSSSCTSTSPLLFPLLEEALPPPDGITPASFYSCISCYSESIPTDWKGDFLANELEERIFGPARHAEDLLRQNPYLTRMFTTISPAEMTEDPEFVRTPVADVSLGRIATRQRQCDNTNVMVINQEELYLQNDFASWPELPATMPAAWRVEEYKEDGSVVVLKDNQPAIEGELTAFNKTRNWPPPTEFTTQSNKSSNCAIGFGQVRERSTARALLGLAGLALVLRRVRRSAR